MTNGERVAELQRSRRQALAAGGEDRIAKRRKGGKRTARERLELLLDPRSFNELDMLVTHRCRDFGMDGQVIPGDGIIVVEAVKMENELKASCCGTVTEVRVEEGRSVNGVDVLVVIE